MAVEFHIADKRNHGIDTSMPTIKFSEDDGDYWFLNPFYEKVRLSTCQVIGPYADCKFEGENLVKLKNEISNEITRLNGLAQWKWQVSTGNTFKEVKKNDLIVKLEAWLSMVEIAIKNDQIIIGVGD